MTRMTKLKWAPEDHLDPRAVESAAAVLRAVRLLLLLGHKEDDIFLGLLDSACVLSEIERKELVRAEIVRDYADKLERIGFEYKEQQEKQEKQEKQK